MNTFELTEPDDAIYAEYSSHFRDYNREKGGLDYQTFSMTQRESCRIIAGGRGQVYLGALEVRGLWVDKDRRGAGLGSHLLTAIEAEGRHRGARKAMLYTYPWQAEPFYQSHGHQTYAKFDFPYGGYRVDMQKTL